MTYKQVCKYLQFHRQDTPTTSTIWCQGLVGSLESEQLTYFKRTRKVHGQDRGDHILDRLQGGKPCCSFGDVHFDARPLAGPVTRAAHGVEEGALLKRPVPPTLAAAEDPAPRAAARLAGPSPTSC